MKNAIIFHWTWDSPENYWLPYVRNWLESMGYVVWAPLMPNAEKPNLQDWLTFALDHGVYTSETILIGHSAGAQLIPSILEKLDFQIEKSILVSGFAKPLPLNESMKKEKDEFRWDSIREKSREFVFINSDNDPWGCDDVQGRKFFDNLGGDLIIRHEWHMGSGTFNQPYREFPLLLKLCSDLKERK